MPEIPFPRGSIRTFSCRERMPQEFLRGPPSAIRIANPLILNPYPSSFFKNICAGRNKSNSGGVFCSCSFFFSERRTLKLQCRFRCCTWLDFSIFNESLLEQSQLCIFSSRMWGILVGVYIYIRC